MTSHPATPEPGARRRGDKQRQAIVQAVRELLQEKPFAELSVSTISLRAGVARSGFYFYFDSKYAVLAQLMAEATAKKEKETKHKHNKHDDKKHGKEKEAAEKAQADAAKPTAA